MYYTQLNVVCDPQYSEILMAEIAEAGFDTFMENEKGFEAYAEQDGFNKKRLQAIEDKYNQVTAVLFSQDRIEKKNWNEEWEKNYEPIVVEEKCIIRAGFHKSAKSYPFEIIITPKMSFGTGHHQTTYLMVKNQMVIDHKNKAVMDAGCGTAVLSVLASKLGAKQVDAFDIDEWSMLNGQENIEINDCKNITLRQGKISNLTFVDNFDIILANINKNILLQEMAQYAAYLSPNGLLLLSGFYENDILDLQAEGYRYGLEKVSSDERESWAVLLLKKK